MTSTAAVHTVPEWGHVPIGEDGLSMSSARRLHALAQRETERLRVPQSVLTRTALPSLQAGQVVGVLTIPGASVEILPKIEGQEDRTVRYALTRMLAVAWGLPIAATEPALLATQRDDLLARLRLRPTRHVVLARVGFEADSGRCSLCGQGPRS